MRDQKFIIKGETHVVKVGQAPASDRNVSELKKIRYLQIPRKPAWTGKTAEEQKQEQNVAFLDWRKHLSGLEESFPEAVLTPYEKNFEVWKQLWYVVEKSDLLIQVIDCRDPLFYRSVDLENYVTESGKQNFLLINKADLVPESVRRAVSDFLRANHRSHAFFSAKLEQEAVDREALREKIEDRGKKEPESEDEEEPKGGRRSKVGKDQPVLAQLVAEEDRSGPPKPAASSSGAQKYDLAYFRDKINSPYMLGRTDLLNFFEFYGRHKHAVHLHDLNVTVDPPTSDLATDLPSEGLVVGMVGYPNVGKSSVINALCGKKKVGVDIKPGKTKNLQTIIFSPLVTLCDCPGLIFPSLVSSKAEMICNGVISVESVMEYVEPVNYILQCVPNLLLKYLYKLPLNYKATEAETLETHYKNQFKQVDFAQLLEEQELNPIGPVAQRDEHQMTARAFLQLFAGTRGYVTGAALPDEAKSAKLVIKDYIQGKMPHFKVPPGSEFVRDLEFEKIVEELKAKYSHSMIIKNMKDEDLVVNEAKRNEELAARDLAVIADVGSEERARKVEFLQKLTEDDLVELIEGKMVEEIKLDKAERRQLKFLVKGDPSMDQVIRLLKTFLFKAPGAEQTKKKK